MCVLSHSSCVRLCNFMDCSLPCFSIHGILQAGILEWDAVPSSRGSSQPRDQTQVSFTAGRFLTAEPPGKPYSSRLTEILCPLISNPPLLLPVAPVNHSSTLQFYQFDYYRNLMLVESCSICLSVVGLFHLELCPQASHILSQIAEFHSF